MTKDREQIIYNTLMILTSNVESLNAEMKVVFKAANLDVIAPEIVEQMDRNLERLAGLNDKLEVISRIARVSDF